jgi:hypothetical protein
MGSVYLYAAVYFLVCIGGNYLVASCMYFMRGRVGLRGEAPFHEWMGVFIGITERAVALTLFLLAPRYLAAFIGGWVLLKFAIGWRRTPLNYKVALGSQVALIGSVLSFAIAIAGGYYLHPDTLAYFGVEPRIAD